MKTITQTFFNGLEDQQYPITHPKYTNTWNFHISKITFGNIANFQKISHPQDFITDHQREKKTLKYENC